MKLKLLNYKKILLVLAITIFSLTPITVFGSETSDDNHYQLIKEYQDDGTVLYYQEFTDGYTEFVSESRYYELLNSGDEMLVEDIDKYREELENPSSDGEESIPAGFASSLMLENRQETIVNDSLDVTDENFQEVIKIKDGDDVKYYVLLTDNRYSEIDKTFYYYFFYKFQRQVKEGEDLNKYVTDNYAETGTVNLKGYLENDIKGYTIYVKVKEYFTKEEFSYFLYAEDDYSSQIILPTGDYYILSGGILNDESYSYPISTPDFSVNANEITNVYFTIGNTELPEKYKDENVTNKEEMLDNLGSDKTNISPEPTVEDVKEYTETVVDDMLTDENNNNPVWFTVLFKIIPVSLVIILLVGIGALFYIKKKNNE